MAQIVKLPQIGISEESAIVGKWYKNVGDTVAEGELLFSVETGKSSFDVDSQYNGVVLALLCAEGDEMPVEAPVCVIGAAGETYEIDTPAAQAESTAAAAAVKEVPTVTAQAVPAAQLQGDRIAASPRARNLAQKAGIDLSGVAPTGAEGRVIERDVRKAMEEGAARTAAEKPAAPAPAPAAAAPAPAAAKAPAAAYEDVPLPQIRKLIAENMHQALTELAQVTIHSSFDATDLLNLRKRCKQSDDPAIAGITLGDMVLYACARTLLEFPDVNAHFLTQQQAMRYFKNVNLGVAVDTPRGLMVPTIFEAEKLRLTEISAKVKELSAAARKGNIDPALLTGGSFTVSNMGGFGIECFTPVINPPQTALLGVCNVTYRMRETADGFAPYPAMGLSLTFDHRAMDGGPSGRFLKELCKRLECFTLLMA